MSTQPHVFEGPARFHLALRVADLDASVAFYQEVFNKEPSKHRPDYAKFEAAWPSLNLTLEKVAATETHGSTLSHMGIQLQGTEALDEQRTRLTDLIAFEEKETDCCYAQQEKFWLADPDGNKVEFFIVLADGDVGPNSRPDGACCPIETPAKKESCCAG